MAMKIRSAKEIKTLSSVLCSGVHLNERHVHEFKLGALELERARRARERQSAIRRIKDIDARLAEVDGLIRRHREALGVVLADAAAGRESRARAGESSRVRRVLRYGG